MNADRGIVTIAVGARPYLDMARDLAYSLRLHCPRIPRAVLTDSNDPLFTSLFDIVIPYRPEYGRGLFPKICIDQYTPFEQTLYIDSDSLVIRDLSFIWSLYSDQEFAFAGHSITTGYWYTDIPVLLAQLNLSSIPSLNGGMLFFKRGAVASRVLERSREIYLDDVTYQFDLWGNARTDEIPLAIAIAEQGILPVPDGGTTMRTPIGIRGEMDIDVLSGRCAFDKQGDIVKPAIAHFATWQFHPVYYRERAKLRLYFGSALTRPLARLGAAYIYWRERALEARRSQKSKLTSTTAP